MALTLRAFSLFVAVAAILTPSAAEAVFVDYAHIDIGMGGQRVAAGWQGLPSGAAPLAPTGTANTSRTPVGPLDMTSETGDAYTLLINNLDASNATVGNIDWRDRGDSTGTDPLVQVAEDHFKNNGGVIRLTFGSLPEGTYNVISYHRDPTFDQTNDIKVSVNNGGGFVLVTPPGTKGNANQIVALNDLNDTNISSSAAVFGFTADGINEVSILFDGRGGFSGNPATTADNETPLNGAYLQFEAASVPEPSSIVLMAMGLAAIGGYCWRRARK